MTYFKPVWCRQIELGAENEIFSLSWKQFNLSRKKLHSNCTLTKAYLYAKEQRILVFQLCRVMFYFCTDLLLSFIVLYPTVTSEDVC